MFPNLVSNYTMILISKVCSPFKTIGEEEVEVQRKLSSTFFDYIFWPHLSYFHAPFFSTVEEVVLEVLIFRLYFNSPLEFLTHWINLGQWNIYTTINFNNFHKAHDPNLMPLKNFFALFSLVFSKKKHVLCI